MYAKPKGSLSLTALAMVLATSSASALNISTDDAALGLGAGTGNGGLFFSVWDTGRQESFILDVGLGVSAFVANGNNAGYSYSITSTDLQTWLGGGNLADMTWNIGGVNNFDNGSDFAGVFTLSTLDPTSPFVAPPGGDVLNAEGFAAQYVDAANSGAGATDNFGIFGVADGLAYFGGGAWSNAWGGAYGFDNAPTLQQASTMVQSAIIDLDNSATSFFAGEWTVDIESGQVSYNVVPVPAAAWLFGSALGLLGWVRRRVA